jgi:hypothetical protein
MLKKKKVQKPKLRRTIVTKPKTSVDIKLPEIVGIKGGTGYMNGGGGFGGLGFGMEIPDLFGSNKRYGNELVGTLYDLKLTNEREPIEMDGKLFKEALKRFCSTWNKNRLDDYFQAPKKKFATHFYIPTISANAAPKAFSVEDIVKPNFWVIHYKGAIAAPETGRYRFWGFGDDIMMVRLKKRVVLQANWNDRKIVDWESDDELNGKYNIFSGSPLFVGDWISMEQGEKVPVDILVGEWGGNLFSCALLIEQEGVSYANGRGGMPVLPVFKTKAITPEVAKLMKVKRDKSTIEGPVFGVVKNLSTGIGVPR